jgi:Holliday junction DNA helicase RuvB
MQLKRLVVEKILDVNSSSRSSTYYKLHDLTQARAILSDYQTQEVRQEGPVALPENLFDVVFGFEGVKLLLRKALTAGRPVHVLLKGPIASAKSIFLQEICRLPGSRFTIGGSNTKAGMEDYVLEYRPHYLIIDEMDKMARKDFAGLYSLTEFGLVTRLKKFMSESVKLDIRVFGAANSLDPIPQEILSRFFVRELPPYDREMFIEVCIAFLTKREGVGRELAEYIANRVADSSKDPRQARHIARLCGTKDEVNALLV